MERRQTGEEVETTLSPTSETTNNEKDLELARTKSLENQVSLVRECLVVLLISLAQFLTQSALGQTLVLVHIIGDHYNVTDPGILSWLIAGYSLTVGTFILFSGRLGDLFGWKKMLIFGYVWFAIWTIISGLAWYSNYVLFIFSRVLVGLGPAILLPNGLAMLGALYQPGKRKNMAFSVFGGCAPVGAISGFLIAGLFNLAWWPWTFWFTGIVLFVTGITAYFVIPDPQDEKPGLKTSSLLERVVELDTLGATLGITALILFNFSWNQAPLVGWQSPYIIVTLILSILLVPAFFYIEIKVAKYPLLPFEVFTADNAFVLGCVACGWSDFGILYFYAWQILYTLRGITPILGAAYYSPIAISGLVAALFTGFLLSRLRSAWVMVMAMAAFMIGTILFATVPPHQIYWGEIFVAMVLLPWGMDMSFPAATIVISNSVDKAHQGTAASLVNTIVNYSISLGLGFAGTVETYTHHSGSTPDEVMLNGYRSAIYMGLGLAGLGIALAVVFLLKSYWMDRRTAQAQQQQEEVRGEALNYASQ